MGKAKFINGKGDDVPLVNTNMTKFEQTVKMAGVGYSFSLDEIGAAQELGRSLTSDGAAAARLAYEQFVDEIALEGDSAFGLEGLYNTTGIATIAATSTFATATPDQVLAEINKALVSIEVDSKGIELADTIILPLAVSATMERRLGDGSDTTILDFITRANTYTRRTGQPLMIEFTHRLTDKMVVYRRDPSVLKMYMPMPLRFISPQFMNFEVKTLGMFRFSPINIRRPIAMRYVTGIA